MKYFLFIWMLFLSALISAKSKVVTITVNSQPTGAKVFVDGQEVGITPCKVSLSGKWVYDIDASKVRNPNNPPYSKKITFVLDGYETATEYWNGKYVYHEAGIGQYRQQYYIVQPDGYSVMAFLKKDPTHTETRPEQQNPINTSQNTIKNSDELIMQCNIDSEPEDARIFWRIISQDNNIRNTELQYLGKTPYRDKKAFRITGLSKDAADNVKVELVVRENGYYDETKLYSLLELLDIMEINGFFELQIKE